MPPCKPQSMRTGPQPSSHCVISFQHSYMWAALKIISDYFLKFTSVSALESLKDPSANLSAASPGLGDYKTKTFSFKFQNCSNPLHLKMHQDTRCFLVTKSKTPLPRAPPSGPALCAGPLPGPQRASNIASHARPSEGQGRPRQHLRKPWHSLRAHGTPDQATWRRASETSDPRRTSPARSCASPPSRRSGSGKGSDSALGPTLRIHRVGPANATSPLPQVSKRHTATGSSKERSRSLHED